MNRTTSYKGFKIQYRYGQSLAAMIWPPGSPLALTDFPEASLQEGYAVLERRVIAVIEAYLARAI